jgi:uncharacterized FlaG/YvyC family protein
MSEETGSIGAIGATSARDDFVSSGDNPPAAHVPAGLPAAVAAVSDQVSRPSEQAVEAAVQEINAHLAAFSRVLSIRVDPSSGYTVAQISNALTGEVLQQMPTNDQIKLERMLAQWTHGGNVLMDEQV